MASSKKRKEKRKERENETSISLKLIHASDDIYEKEKDGVGWGRLHACVACVSFHGLF